MSWYEWSAWLSVSRTAWPTKLWHDGVRGAWCDCVAAGSRAVLVEAAKLVTSVCLAGLQNQPDGDAGDIVVLHLSASLSRGVSNGTLAPRGASRQGCHWHFPRPG